MWLLVSDEPQDPVQNRVIQCKIGQKNFAGLCPAPPLGLTPQTPRRNRDPIPNAHARRRSGVVPTQGRPDGSRPDGSRTRATRATSRLRSRSRAAHIIFCFSRSRMGICGQASGDGRATRRSTAVADQRSPAHSTQPPHTRAMRVAADTQDNSLLITARLARIIPSD